MRHAAFALVALLALAACREDDTASAQPAAPAPENACGAAELQDLVGKTFSPDFLPPGTEKVRVLHPDSVMTMDFRSDRLNIRLDDSETITEIYCG
ncbi:hypothetical protein ATO6_06735 [Oceanicola sp. 22II-s10i]|uniref:I78 family peptidase inhibitor n=1 Tax=Oceanicola sp. 22II-s10i TaxID=1317116 RepID=UPI000B525000|nr:I78 family peptidase inhibitor [Oceanicola sp. 22II-s10i]OWU86495.1 hypothetical protein ATO6_06735 [Oceanicola sp. 22II-s10i]